MSRGLRLGIDADGTLYNLVDPWLKQWAFVHNRPEPSYEQIIHYNAHLAAGPGGTQLSPEDEATLYQFLERPGLFEDSVKPCLVALRYAKKWHDEGHEVRIVSAPAGPESAKGKLKAFRRDFPWLNRKHIDLMHHKHLLDLDVLIDDSADVIRKCTNFLTLGIEQPWNAQVVDREMIWSCLAKSWREPEKAWAELDRHIQQMAHGFGLEK